MKRDLDLCRQLLADIEGHGPDCAVTALRHGLGGEVEETVRHHLRLLIDAGFVKEVDRVAGGAACVRLTNAGHEMIELSASEARWREAKWVVGQRTGTQSLTVIRSVLVRWATEAAAYGERWRPLRGYAPQRPYAYGGPYRTATRRVEPRYRFERDGETADEAPLSTTTPRGPYTYLERFDWRTPVDWRDAANRDAYYRDSYYRDPLYRADFYRDETLDLDGVTLPTHVV